MAVPRPRSTRNGRCSFVALLATLCCFCVCFIATLIHPAAADLSSVFNLTQQQLDLAEVKLAQFNVTAYFLGTYLPRNNKSYGVAEIPRRLDLFQNTLAAILKSHEDFAASNRTTYWLKITQFADATPEEMKQNYTGLVSTPSPPLPPAPPAYPPAASRRQALAAAAATPPASLDWRAAPFGAAVTSIKNQGSCNDCWAFSTTAAVETAAAISSQQPAVDLSEMQVLNCAPTTGGCSSGNTLPGGFQYFQQSGVTSLQNFPYTATYSHWSQGSGCTPTAPLTNITKYTNVQAASVSALQSAVATTAVSIAICSTTLANYGGGLITSAGICAGCDAVDHAVVVVGYDTTPSGAADFSDSTTNYFIVKNSWGPTWGAAGYAYFAMSGGRSSSSLFGPCQILQEPVSVLPSAVNVQAAAGGSGGPAQSPTQGTSTGTNTVTPPPSPAPPSPPVGSAGGPPRVGVVLLSVVGALVATLALSPAWV